MLLDGLAETNTAYIIDTIEGSLSTMATDTGETSAGVVRDKTDQDPFHGIIDGSRSFMVCASEYHCPRFELPVSEAGSEFVIDASERIVTKDYMNDKCASCQNQFCVVRMDMDIEHEECIGGSFVSRFHFVCDEVQASPVILVVQRLLREIVLQYVENHAHSSSIARNRDLSHERPPKYIGKRFLGLRRDAWERLSLAFSHNNYLRQIFFCIVVTDRRLCSFVDMIFYPVTCRISRMALFTKYIFALTLFWLHYIVFIVRVKYNFSYIRVYTRLRWSCAKLWLMQRLEIPLVRLCYLMAIHKSPDCMALGYMDIILDVFVRIVRKMYALVSGQGCRGKNRYKQIRPRRLFSISFPWKYPVLLLLIRPVPATTPSPILISASLNPFDVAVDVGDL